MDSARQKLLSVVPGSGPQGVPPQGSPYPQAQAKPYCNGPRMSPAPSTGSQGLLPEHDAGFQVRWEVSRLGQAV